MDVVPRPGLAERLITPQAMNRETKSIPRPLRLSWIPLLGLILSACVGPAEHIWLNAPGWARAQLVGTTQVVDPVSMALDDAGTIYLFLTVGDQDTNFPRVVALNRRAEVLWDRTYDIALKWADQSRILWDGQALQLFWLSDRGLYNAQVEPTGGGLSGTTLLSGETKVGSYDVARDINGLMTVWYAGMEETPGLYALPPGDLNGEENLVDPDGIRPDLQYDDQGTLHATWARYPTGGIPHFFYAAYPDDIVVPGQQTSVLEPQLGTTSIFGPWLGLDKQQVYILWTAVPRLGQAAGMAATRYIHFPHGQPDLASPVGDLSIPYDYHLAYETSVDGGLQAGPRVPLPYDGTDYIIQVAVNPNLAPELVIAFQTSLGYLRRQEQSQVSTAFFRDGTPVGYQLLSFTPASSNFPAILSDEAGYLYLTWLESGATSGYLVYFASTAPDIRESVSRLTVDDATRLVAETIFGLMASIVLIPWVLAWIIAPLIILGLTLPLRRESNNLRVPGVVVSLALALVAYWISKLVLMPGMLSYVPFSAWVPVFPAALKIPLRVIMPLLIATLAVLTAWRYTYRAERPSALFFLLIYAVVDGGLTMAAYGTVFYGAF